MKKLLLLGILLSTEAFSLSPVFFNMKPDVKYMGFVTDKYLEWHRKTFSFPVLSPEEREIQRALDHWLVPGHENLFQLTLGHTAGDDGNRISLRMWIAPSLRNSSRFKGSGLPENFDPWFYERKDSGETCLVGKKDIKTFEAFCRTTAKGSWNFHHREVIADTHIPWKNYIPVMSEDEIRYLDKDGKVFAISYYRGVSHISLIPKSLVPVVSVHSRETAYSMERHRIDQDGTMTIFYP